MMPNGFWNESWTAAIFNHLWQSSLVILVAWLLTLVLRRNQARTRYWVWMAASLKLLLPFFLLTAMGGWFRPASVSTTESPQIPSAMIRMAHPLLWSMEGTDPVAGALPLSAAVASSSHHVGPSEFFILLWLCGLLFLLFRWSRGWWSIRTMLRGASRVSLPMDVPVLLTSHRIEPGIVGIVRPVLLLPEQLIERLSRAQLRSILAHESCHVRRRDNLTAAMHMVVEAIFWFHPAVWWIERRLIEERERACDEAVLQLGNEAEVYAESILNVCKFYTESPLACMSGVTGSDLKQRIFRIMAKQVALKLDLSRKLLLSAVGIMAVSVPVVFGLLHITEVRAQTAPADPASHIAATWQGILHANRDQRFVIKIIKGDGGALRATFYNIDGEPGGIPAISTTLNHSLLKVELPFATYQGTLSADGSAITGTWRQRQNSQPLNFARATNETEWTIPQPPTPLAPMAADVNPAFEVATIKPSGPDEHGPRYDFQGHRFSVIHASLNDLIKFSYGLQQSQIVKAEDWVNSESYDISAEPDGEGEPSIKQWQSMVKKLMADRFHLKFHLEKREQSVYVVTVVKTGPKLTRSESDPGASVGLGFGPGNFGATNATMADIADALGQGVLNRPVVDQTGLTGRYDLRLAWTPDGLATATENSNDLPDFFTATQEQLGLKLVSTKAPVDVLLIDHVERSSPN
ncbi:MULTISPECIES: M56 family metallopeptidase [Acidobacteriaceae]|uniref:M56 family metallopeptidase n=1 Tax=Acidobacteriaceae TaxID=204434 RepID=UPI00131DEEE2|nr:MULTISPECIES: M56 family metallopeptidase [Acidobacteriaceae]MDW5265216.1 M56 family metallopeptidase [Edaphobacter sp.]